MPTAIRPPRSRGLFSIAALAAGALVATAVALISGGGDVRPPMPTLTSESAAQVQPRATEEGPAADTNSAAPAPGPAAPDPDGAATPIDAVRGFVAGLDSGNAEAAYRLMHPRYRAAFNSYPAFVDDPAPATTFGPFAALGGAGFQSAVFEATAQGESVAVVSVYGEVTRDGVPVTEAVSMVARKAASGWLVEAGGEGGSVFQEPADPGEQITAGDDLVLWTPTDGLSAVLAVVGGEPRETTVTELVDPSETAEIRVDDYSPGSQQVAIGILREDGSVDAIATYFLA